MPDPFEQLRALSLPLEPDPRFAARLRARLSRVLAGPAATDPIATEPADTDTGPIDTEPAAVDTGPIATEPADTDPAEMEPAEIDPAHDPARPVPIRGGTPMPDRTPAALTPYLAVAGAAQALDWYAEAFGARLRAEPLVMGDGRIGHAELDLDGAVLMLADEAPTIGVVAPIPGAGASVTLHLGVTDVDAVMERAMAAGAQLERPVADYPYGRNGVLRDPFGHRWLVDGPVRAASAPSVPASAPSVPGSAPTVRASALSMPGSVPFVAALTPSLPALRPRHGDIGYVSLWVPDGDRAARFYAAVLGWRYRPGSGPRGRQVEGLSLHHGLWGGVTPATLFCCYAVDDVEAAAVRAREAGGTAGEPVAEPYGRIVECSDDQGTRFALYEPPEGVADARAGATAKNGTVHGDLAYVTMEVVDSARARAFYGSVLGWRFAPGPHPEGWQVEGTSPMVGLSGGHQRATTVPMYRVEDIEAAVTAVRTAGGDAPEPERQPYGLTALCADDQATRFYLGELD